MITKINKTEELRKQLNDDGKVSYLDTPKHIEAIALMNKEMEEVRREYKEKETNSQISAATVVLTA